ncbi:MAG: hypothetical protein ACOYWZ_09055 [Bacillota bacterium]
MSNNDLNKNLADILNNMDKKALQENLNKALDVLKNGNTEELAKQIASVTKSPQGAKPSSADKAALDKMNIDADAIKNLNSTDLEKILKYIGSHGNEIKDKLKDIIK